ncbi:MAG: SDR family NAD(P)-dependent oxidoreductase [Deltaproteobacteria bacterium]|nr:SDR family NAD(P)-dependent oxidoreductase [Deltaproteobacteria bacterium]
MTGAASGLGFHFCKAFLREGAKVGLNNIYEESIDQANVQLSPPGSVLALLGDVRQNELIEAIIFKVVDFNLNGSFLRSQASVKQFGK